ncbi:MAG: F0F1 ATP synthase subunit gamma, partial [Dermacoccus nishinomiyaensis]
MGAQQRVYRQRIRSVQATKKITRAMELIAASRVVKAREAVAKSTPYAVALTRAVSSVASSTSDIDHALTTERENVKRAGVLIVTADRGLAGSYSVNAMKEAQQLITKLEHEGKEVVPYLVGRKGVSYYKFRRREYEAEWTGFTDSPKFENAEEIGERLTADFHAGAEGGGVDELHVVYTEFQSMVTQQARVIRLLPLEVAEGQLDLDGDGKPDGR